MTATIDQQILQIAPYNFYMGKMPDVIDPVAAFYVHYTRKALSQKPLRAITTVVLSGYSRARTSQPKSLKFYVFGTFRRHFPVIERLSGVLAPVFSETHILPLIEPLIAQEWSDQVTTHGEVYTKIQRSGIVIYSLVEERK